jgi:hypothetical protein
LKAFDFYDENESSWQLALEVDLKSLVFNKILADDALMLKHVGVST